MIILGCLGGTTILGNTHAFIKRKRQVLNLKAVVNLLLSKISIAHTIHVWYVLASFGWFLW